MMETSSPAKSLVPAHAAKTTKNTARKPLGEVGHAHPPAEALQLLQHQAQLGEGGRVSLQNYVAVDQEARSMSSLTSTSDPPPTPSPTNFCESSWRRTCDANFTQEVAGPDGRRRALFGESGASHFFHSQCHNSSVPHTHSPDACNNYCCMYATRPQYGERFKPAR